MNNDTIFKSSITITTLMETEILPLKVDMKIGLNFDDTDPYHQAIALERVRYTINLLFNDAIFGSRKNELLPKLKEITSTRVVECWDEPWDQFIAIMIYYKISAVLQDKGHIDFINITGDSISDDLEYTYYADMLHGSITDEDLDWMRAEKLDSLWYHRADTTVNEDDDSMEPSWEMLGLVWTKTAEKPLSSETNNIRHISKFTPKIIK